jgi:uncharacterized protein (TIGR01319 family)
MSELSATTGTDAHRLDHSRPDRFFLLIDCGSTTTKAVLIGPRPDRPHVWGVGEAPTTVEAPLNDVRVGVRAACVDLARAVERPLLAPDGSSLILPATRDAGSDALLCSSSAGGGLQMLVLGAVRSMTAESAAKAALGAGAIVSEVFASNDTRAAAEQITLLRLLQPDMILLSGGVDGGSSRHVLQLAELIAAANPQPRHGTTASLPVVYAGNRDARDAVEELLSSRVALTVTDNIRPSLEVEDLLPAKEKIHAVFMEHVMSRAPGYTDLADQCAAPIVPTPAACGDAIALLAAGQEGTVVAVDIGGATTDIFSVRAGELRRSVSANLGVSYSIANVCRQRWSQVQNWLPVDMPVGELRDRILNKMIRPTTLPQELVDLYLEQAVARLAMTLAWEQHRQSLTDLKGLTRQHSMGEVFFQQSATGNSFDIGTVSLLIGRGGVLTHAPRSAQAALMLLDAFAPVGVTRLALDRFGILPQLGVLAGFVPEVAQEVLTTQALTALGVCVAPLAYTLRAGSRLARIRLTFASGQSREGDLTAGNLACWELPADPEADLEIYPESRIDFGAGRGQRIRTRVRGGDCGLLLDGRQRERDTKPGRSPDSDRQSKSDRAKRWKQLRETYRVLGLPLPDRLPSGEES